MTRRLGLMLLVLLAVGDAATAVERFPPPDFESGYVLPDTDTPAQQPVHESAAWGIIDTALLAGFIVLATLLALKWRTRRGLLWLTVAAVAYFGFIRQGCVCPIGAIQNVAEGAFGIEDLAVPLVVTAFFLIPLVGTLLWGRTFCGAVCPLGAVQDLVLVRPVRVPTWLEHSLGLLAYVYLGLAVLLAIMGSGYIICEYDPFVSIFRMVDVDGFVASGGIHLLLLAGLFVGVGLFVGRPYCRYLCPLGAIFRVLGRVSWKRVTITPTECVRCGLCEDACPYGAILKPVEPSPTASRTAGKARLVAVLALVPVLLVGGGVLGWWLGPCLASIDRRVELAHLVRMDEAGTFENPTDEQADQVEAFRTTGRSPEDLYDEAAGVVAGYTGHWSYWIVTLWNGAMYTVGLFIPGGAAWLGVFVGLVVGLKFVELSIRRKRTDYEADRAKCVACGRCFAYCPVERDRHKKMRIVAEPQARESHRDLPHLRAGEPAKTH